MLKNKIQAAFNLTRNDWGYLFQAWVLLLVVDIGLRTLPFRRMQSFAAGGKTEQELSPNLETEAEIQRAWRMTRIASRNHLYPMTCLRRSLTLQRILNKRGIWTFLRFGVQKETGELKAHAWLEYQGKPFGEPESLTEQYIALLAGQRPTHG